MKIFKFLIAALAFAGCLFIIPNSSTYADETGDFRTFEVNLPVEKVNVQYDIPVEAGRNYTVTVYYKAFDEVTKNLNIFFEDVTEDETVPNIKTSDDRSGLLNETVAPGEEGSRTFSYAAIDDTLNLIVAGNVTLVKVEIQLLPQSTAGEKRTVYLVGDSQLKENAPKTGWAQVIDRYFTDDIIFSNQAIGARSTGSYIRQGRWNQVLLSVKPGDYVFVDFGHNDGGGVAGRAVTLSNYQKYLEEVYIESVRQRGGIPVIVTIGNRNNINRNSGIAAPTLPNYVAAACEAAANKNAPLIDLNAESIIYLQNIFNAYGPNATTELLYIDGTHYSEYGAIQMAGIVAKGIFDLKLEGLYEYYIAPTVPTEVPAQISDFTVQNDGKAVLSWSAVESADFYIIERAVIENKQLLQDFTLFAYSVSTGYTDATIKDSWDYAYRVLAVNDAGFSEATPIYCTDSDYVYVDPSTITPPLPTNTPAPHTPIPTPVPDINASSEAGVSSVLIVMIALIAAIVIIPAVVITVLLIKHKKNS